MVVGVLKDVCSWVNEVLVPSFIPGDNVLSSIDELDVKLVFSYPL